MRVFLGISIVLGGILRFANLGTPPFWVDECLFIKFATGLPTQEFIPVLVAKLIGSTDEFWIRFPFALTGTMTIWAVYHVASDKRLGSCAALFVAVFPLFVFWSRMARPYAFAVFFIALGWRYPWAYFIAVLTTPIALMGIDLGRAKKLWKVYLSVAVIATASYFLRADVREGKEFLDLNFLADMRRIYVIPAFVCCLYLVRYLGTKRVVENTASH